MPQIQIEIAPPNTDLELTNYLNRQFQNINDALSRTGYFNPRYTLPDKPRDGVIEYFGEALLPEVPAPGFWGYKNGEWVYLGADNSVVAAYGGVASGSYLTMPDVTTVWNKVAIFGEPMLIEPRGVIQDTGANELALPYAGVYRMGITLSLKHNEVNSSRNLEFRLRNQSTGDISNTIAIGTGRNQDTTTLATPGMLLEIFDDTVTNNIRLQVRSDDSYINVEGQGVMGANMVSERRF